MSKKILGLGLLGLILLAAPLLTDDYTMNLLIFILFYAYLGQAWNIMCGLSGQFSFGHAAFYGIGAYTSSLLGVKVGITPWLGMVVGAVVAVVVGWGIGFLTFRYKLKGAYFALATLAFAEILRLVVSNTELFNKTQGVLLPLHPGLINFQFDSKAGYYYVILLMLIGISVMVWRLTKTRFGLYLAAIRENEEAAKSLGVNTFREKMLAVGMSAGLTAMGGTFYAQYLLYIDPGIVFSPDMSVSILLPAILGGTGTVWGPILGSFLLTPLGELTRGLLGGYSGVHLIVYGLVLILCMLYLPDGLVGWWWRRKGRFLEASSGSADGRTLRGGA